VKRILETLINPSQKVDWQLVARSMIKNSNSLQKNKLSLFMAFCNKKRFNYPAGRGYYVSIKYETRDASEFDKGNADILVLYAYS